MDKRLADLKRQIEWERRAKEADAQEAARRVRERAKWVAQADAAITSLHQEPDYSEFDPHQRPLTTRQVREMKQRGELKREAERQAEEQRLAREARWKAKVETATVTPEEEVETD